MSMYEIVAEVFIAVLAFVGTMAGSIMVSQKTTWRLDELERKVEKHNNLVERVFLLEHDDEETRAELERLRAKVEEMREA